METTKLWWLKEDNKYMKGLLEKYRLGANMYRREKRHVRGKHAMLREDILVLKNRLVSLQMMERGEVTLPRRFNERRATLQMEDARGAC